MFLYKPKEDKDNESMNVIIDLLNYRVWDRMILGTMENELIIILELRT